MNDIHPEALVDVSVVIEASPDTVWNIVSTPEGFSGWMDATAEFEPRVGSPFKADFPNYGIVMSGEVASFDTETKTIAFTWGVESGPQADTFPAGSSLVEVQVTGDPEGCHVRLRQTRVSPDSVEQHASGWRFHLSRMALHANRSDLAGALARTLPAWFNAWNESDGEARLQRLRDCCADDVAFSDEWAVADGIELLSLHIGNTHHYMPGWRLELAGDPRVCRGEILFDWRALGPNEEQVSGINHARVAADGMLRRVVGFPNGSWPG